MAQICPAKSTIVPFKKQMYSSGSIILSYKDDKCICVSIHAPTRGATGHDALYVWCRLVSIHAPTRGATLKDFSACALALRFNPRTHEGCDRDNHRRGKILIVSIHAPTRGATVSNDRYVTGSEFQSTHPRGVRRTLRVDHFVCRQFQSTHPRGVRLLPIVHSLKYGVFQSTHPRGVRLNASTRYRSSHQVSIHAPTRGATSNILNTGSIQLFQSTHPRGVRPVAYAFIN